MGDANKENAERRPAVKERRTTSTMATPPVLAFLLLLLVSSFSHASAAAVLPAHSNPNPFPTTTPLHLQARRHQRVRQPNSPADATKLAAADDTGTTAGPFTVHYFQQELDHFSFTPNASTVFYQKYLVNDTFWRRPGGGGTAGPLLVYVGGEADIECIAHNVGFMFDVAPTFGALLVFVEVQILHFAECKIISDMTK